MVMYRGGQFNGGRMVMSEVSLNEGEQSCYGGTIVVIEVASLMERGNGHVREVVSLMEGEWSCYRGGQFNGGRMVMLQRWSV